MHSRMACTSDRQYTIGSSMQESLRRPVATGESRCGDKQAHAKVSTYEAVNLTLADHH